MKEQQPRSEWEEIGESEWLVMLDGGLELLNGQIGQLMGLYHKAELGKSRPDIIVRYYKNDDNEISLSLEPKPIMGFKTPQSE